MLQPPVPISPWPCPCNSRLTQVLRIATELLSVLKYLGSLRPPVVHRDIKPENVVLEGGEWGGRVYLIDFGGVQGTSSTGAAVAAGCGFLPGCGCGAQVQQLPMGNRAQRKSQWPCHPRTFSSSWPHLPCSSCCLTESFASTIVGSYGYMAPEQFRWGAEPGWHGRGFARWRS
jgi:serine/threonine protein kinase